MANDENLTPFQPGQSGNPDGRPQGAKDGLRVRLARSLQKDSHPKLIERLKEKGVILNDNTHAEVISEVLIRAAEKGDMVAIKQVFLETELPIPREHKLDHSGSIDTNGGLSRLDRILEDFASEGQSLDAEGDV
jgi:hypothetical protein